MTAGPADNPIKRARKAAGLTQTEAAARCGWSQGQWNDFENARYDDPKISTYRAAAAALNCKIRDLIDE